jgi:transcriptional regulator with GAF, ATPase, and Fis domain/CheY-like chemotaxis protein
MEKIKILYVDDEPDNLLIFRLGLRHLFEIVVTSNPFEGVELIRDIEISVLVTDQRMPGINGLELARLIMKIRPEVPIIILTAYDDSDVMRDAINLGGIFRYVLKPWNLEELKQTLINAHATFLLRRENGILLNDLKEKNQKLQAAFDNITQLKAALEEEKLMLKEDYTKLVHTGAIIGKSKALMEVLKDISFVAKSDASVLLIGETGTGKELFAKMLHKESVRKNELMVSINCASIPEALVESELFGYERGAFSGAVTLKYGKLEVANRGTLFLDEIGELPLNVQPKLLRVLQEKEFERLGGVKTIKTDFRLISATNRNVEEALRKGNFRYDLYYRINTIPIVIPPLRERLEDLPLLVSFFVERFNRQTGKKINAVPRQTLEKLSAYDWPGNIRELSNVIERAHVLSRSNKLIVSDNFKTITEDGDVSNTMVSLAEMEKKHILKILRTTNWKIRGPQGAARILGLNPNTLDSRIKKLGIAKEH